MRDLKRNRCCCSTIRERATEESCNTCQAIDRATDELKARDEEMEEAIRDRVLSELVGLTYSESKKKSREIYVVETLKKFDGNISKTARETTLSRRTIHRIIEDAGGRAVVMT